MELFFEQALRFFEAKNIDWQNNIQQKRVLAIVASNLQKGATAWFSTIKDSIVDIEGLEKTMRRQ